MERTPEDAVSAVVIHTRSGVRLVADVWEPEPHTSASLGNAPRATVVLGHAMMASRRTFSRGLAPSLWRRGFRVVSFDFRGHGESGTPAARGGAWTYDDLVGDDVPAVLESVRDRFDGPVAVVGHSLGAHVAAAAIGTQRTSADALVFLAGNVWLPQLEPSLRQRVAKRAILEATGATVRGLGYLPVRRLGLGSDDESAPYFLAFLRWWREDAWTSDDGDDYLESLARVRCPVLALASTGDRLACAPPAASRFAQRLGSTRATFEIVRDGVTPAPDHMGFVTRATSAPVWARVGDWLEQQLA